METWGELNINSQSLTDGQLAYTAPTNKQTTDMKKEKWLEEGQAI